MSSLQLNDNFIFNNDIDALSLNRHAFVYNLNLLLFFVTQFAYIKFMT